MQTVHKLSKISALILLASASASATANSETKAKASIDLNLRYEAVDQDNTKKEASALTLRTRLNYTSASYNGFSAAVEVEDSRQLGVDDYNDTVGNNTEYSVIADPETTEIDQAFVQYKKDGITAKVGRQVLTLDNHRYVGHVGWRQDRQTFDAATVTYAALENVKMSYSYINKRNRIFSNEKDFDSKDHLLNISYKASYGKLTAYSYLLEVDEGTANSLDTFGVSFNGKKDKLSYSAEFATQDSESGGTDYSASYMAIQGGYSFDVVTVKLGAEVLGSDDSLGHSRQGPFLFHAPCIKRTFRILVFNEIIIFYWFLTQTGPNLAEAARPCRLRNKAGWWGHPLKGKIMNINRILIGFRIFRFFVQNGPNEKKKGLGRLIGSEAPLIGI